MRLIGDAVNLLISVQQSGWGTKENEKPHSTNDPTYERDSSSTTWKGRPLKTQKRSTQNENSKIPPNHVNEESMN